MGHFFRSDDTTEAYTESKEEVGEEYSSTSQLEHTQNLGKIPMHHGVQNNLLVSWLSLLFELLCLLAQ